MGKYFGTDGIRGEVNKELTSDLAFKVGKALEVLKCSEVVIGYDTRLSNHMLYNAIAAGALAVNINVIYAGVITTPGLSYYSKLKKIIGIMITASHNPYQDNGIKIFLSGQKLDDDLEEAVEERIDNPIEKYNPYNAIEVISSEPVIAYINYLLELGAKNKLKLGLDCANGATSEIANHVFSKLTDDLFVTANNPDGKNINKDCGATVTKNISEFVLKNKLDIGFSFDGDGDRLMVADNTGKVYCGDEMLYVMANYLKLHSRLKSNTLVLTKMSNIGIINSLKRIGINTVLTDVGDRNILEEMLRSDYSIGGENSGHFIILELLGTGDGIISALFILKILNETGKTLQELTKDIVIYPDRLDNLRVKNKKVAKEEVVVNRVKAINNELGSEGLLIVRASGTENLVRVSCCAKTKEIVDKYVDELVELIKGL